MRFIVNGYRRIALTLVFVAALIATIVVILAGMGLLK
jgi:hypothetical protein